MPLKTLNEWVADAVALAPDAVTATEARRLINENLGPMPMTTDLNARLARAFFIAGCAQMNKVFRFNNGVM